MGKLPGGYYDEASPSLGSFLLSGMDVPARQRYGTQGEKDPGLVMTPSTQFHTCRVASKFPKSHRNGLQCISHFEEKILLYTTQERGKSEVLLEESLGRDSSRSSVTRCGQLLRQFEGPCKGKIRSYCMILIFLAVGQKGISKLCVSDCVCFDSS